MKTLKQYFPENGGSLISLLVTGYHVRDTTDLAYKLLETLLDSSLDTDVTMDNTLYSFRAEMLLPHKPTLFAVA